MDIFYKQVSTLNHRLILKSLLYKLWIGITKVTRLENGAFSLPYLALQSLSQSNKDWRGHGYCVADAQVLSSRPVLCFSGHLMSPFGVQVLDSH